MDIEEGWRQAEYDESRGTNLLMKKPFDMDMVRTIRTITRCNLLSEK
jgi:hypothetical protein